ncbi:MAG TPA: 2-oxoglutarate dehydrogenase, E2 component, dihydrolipoamide succinyltransferase [Aeromicrobium sp.]|nr:2-oxoglutarate dehydrogenase, E2 component, dihydrolipoamide succinyltransferase [Aeromicrobium sp.]
MATSVSLPALGESVTEGTVTRWLKNVGDEIAVDEPLVEISTDKVDTEIPSPVAGVLLEIKAEEDETIEVGAELAVIGEAGESAGSAPAPAAEAPAEEPPAQEAPAAEQEAPPQEAPAQEAPAQEATAAEAPTGPDTRETAEGTEIVLPALGESVTEGTVTRWLKNVGDEIAVDEPLLEISTDKVDTEVPSPVAGTLVEIRAAEDETVEVGAVLAVVGTAGSAPAAEAPAAEAPAAAEPTPAPQEPAKEAPASSGTDTYVTPIVRKLAKQHGVDLESIEGTGVGGRIRKQDVLDAAAKAPEAAAPAASTPAAAGAPSAPSPLRGKTEKITRLRNTIATRMVQSLQVSAQLTQVHEVDVTEVARLRARAKDSFAEREGVKLTFLPFFAKAAIEALKQYPIVNAAADFEAGEITYPSGEHLGIAVDTEKGLIVPTIRDAGDLSVAGLAKRIADAAERTRTNKITPDELSGATFTITNLGSNGALFDTPIINQPQVAILGVGAVVKRPVVVTDSNGGESIAIRSMAYLALTYDHRVVDGADAGRFLTAVKNRLQGGSFEGELG